ncbi:MAG: hypothetical protein ACJA2S_001953 [Cyclobacteriaceae bacterium]|jgi:hypothetical protein
MKSITLHNLDDDLVDLTERESNDTGLSLNKTIKNLLHKALGTNPKVKKQKEEEFSDLLGIWDDKKFDEFNKNTKDFDEINTKDWE